MLRQADSDDHVRSVLIAGAGDNFSVGGDVKNFGATLELTPGERRQAYEQRVLAGFGLLSTLDRFSKPLVAMVRGAVAGAGITLALAADFVVGSEDCFFVFAHTKIGLSPDAGLSYFLPRVVGPQKALQLVLAGARVDSAEALRIGLIERRVSASELEGATDSLVATLSRGATTALIRAKRLMKESMNRDLREQLKFEASYVGECAATGDFEEGVRAFLEKRRAQFQGR
jgi:2-(1,2-epoxy-1,2-dihydrophenyl)acetyl-CoA isomerase